MKKPQWITIVAAVILTLAIFIFGRTIPEKQVVVTHHEGDGHDHDIQPAITIDTILLMAKKEISTAQLSRVTKLEEDLEAGKKNLSPGASIEEPLHVYHQLARFWADTARVFEPFAWYRAEAARLENSEKSLTFAARLFLENLQSDEVMPRRQWKALQAKDLFERALKINPANDSAKVGIGAAYLFGNISSAPMEGILKIREVADRDSTNLYAQMTLAKGSMISGQYDKAITRLQSVNRIKPGNLEAVLLLADVYERMNDKKNAVEWYRKSLQLTSEPALLAAIQERIDELGK